MRFVRALFVPLALTVLLAGCGGHQTTTAAAAGTRTIDVTMVDNAFQPSSVTVKRGETVTFRFRNAGMVRHEGVVGDDAVQDRHHAEMASSSVSTTAGGMEHGHGEKAAGSTAVTVEPGQSQELTHTFDEGGAVLIGCHEPGHWEAGMKATVAVT